MTDGPVIVETQKRGSGAGWMIAIVLVIAVIVGAVLFSQVTGSEVAKDNAVANAANSVGDAAQSAGDAAKSPADNTTN